MVNYKPQHLAPRPQMINLKGVANRAVATVLTAGLIAQPLLSPLAAIAAPSIEGGDSTLGGCSYSFVNWEMLSARLNRGMLTPGHSAGGLQSARCASARRRKAPCPA